MIYFRKKVISYSPGVAQKIVESLKNRTANKYGFLDVASTATWVIFPERKFVGINLKNGGIKLARYRSPIFSFLPKVIAKITSETQGDGSILKIRFRFGLLSFLLRRCCMNKIAQRQGDGMVRKRPLRVRQSFAKGAYRGRSFY
ncbi:MAG: hypothetical protein SF052_01530 [Bacteroidia bacterium]|nr:hypothetical protein [Bacteroidia bacterium]